MRSPGYAEWADHLMYRAVAATYRGDRGKAQTVWTNVVAMSRQELARNRPSVVLDTPSPTGDVSETTHEHLAQEGLIMRTRTQGILAVMFMIVGAVLVTAGPASAVVGNEEQEQETVTVCHFYDSGHFSFWGSLQLTP